MVAHLSDEQIAGYRARSIAPAELLDLDRHLSECESCRERLYEGVNADASLRDLRGDLSEHLSYEMVVASAEDMENPEARQHVSECAVCRAEVEDLRRFQRELKTTPIPVMVSPVRSSAVRWPGVAGIAAGVLLVAGGVWWAAKPQAPVPATPMAKAPQEPPLTADQQEALQAAASTRRLERAPVLDRLIGRDGVLLGAPTRVQPFQVAAPMGTTVLTDRPLFRWQPARGATRYVVAIFDEDFRKVAESPAITGTEWQPATALPRGRVLNWQVTASGGGQSVHAPQPPAPEARFEIVAAEAAEQFDAVRRDHPSNHLLLAALLARLGALDDTAKELDALAATDPGATAALLESLAALRKPPAR